MSPPSCPISGTEHVTPRFPRAGPHGHGSPPSTVLSGRYDFLLRTSFGLLVRQPAPCGCLFIRVRYRAPVASRPDAGPGSGLVTLAVPLQRPRPRARAGSPRFPGSPSYDSAPVHDPGRPCAPRPWRRCWCCPQVDHPVGVVIATIEAPAAASSPAVYASRPTLPLAMQNSLPAGGLRLCRAGVEPAGALRKVSDQIILLPRTSPGARSNFHARPHRIDGNVGYGTATGSTQRGSSIAGVLTRVLAGCTVIVSGGQGPSGTASPASQVPNASRGKITGMRS